MRLNGNLVHYVVPDGPERVHGQCRPAFVVQDHGSDTENPRAVCHLLVFRDGADDERVITDGTNTAIVDADLMQWETNVPHSKEHHFRSWHLPDECQHKEA